MKPNAIEVHVLDVGQGDSMLLRLPSGGWGVVDCHMKAGQTEPPALTFLRKRRVRELELVVLTHPDIDHFRGMGDLLNYFSTEGRRVKRFWRFGGVSMKTIYSVMKMHLERARDEGEAADDEMERLRNRCREFSKIVYWYYGQLDRCAAGDTEVELLSGPHAVDVLPGGVVAYCLNPSSLSALRAEEEAAKAIFDKPDVPDPSAGLNGNEFSAVLLLKHGDARVLLGSDAPVAAWLRTLPRYEKKAELLGWPSARSHFVKVSHHGSRDSSRPCLWEAIVQQDAVAAISAGKHARFDHPHVDTLEHISASSRSVDVYCTKTASTCRDGRDPLREYALLAGYGRRPTGTPYGDRCCRDMCFCIDSSGVVTPRFARPWPCPF